MTDLKSLSAKGLVCLDVFEFVVDNVTVKGEIHCSKTQMLVKIKFPFEIEKYRYSPPLVFAGMTLKLYSDYLDSENLSVIEDAIIFAKRMYLECKENSQ